MSKVKFVVTGPTTGGFHEGNAAYMAKWGVPINKKALPSFGEVALYDASTPVPDFRLAEPFLTLVALAKTSALVKIVTEIGSGGTYAEYGSVWGFKSVASQFWLDFYKSTGIMDRVDHRFAPMGLDVFEVAKRRKAITLGMWQNLAPYLDQKFKSGLNLQVSVFENEFGHIKLRDLISAVKDGGVIMSFCCPLCSHQAKAPKYHAVRRQGNGILITNDERAQSKSGCKGTFPWKEHFMELTVFEAGNQLGAKLNGKTTYYMSSLSLMQPFMFIRDYSNPRGTVAQAIGLWRHSGVAISPRLYVHGTLAEMQLSIKNHPKEWAEIIKKFPLHGDGRTFDVRF